MAKEKLPFSSILDQILSDEPDYKALGLADAKDSGDDVLDRTHQYADTDFEDMIAESASKHTPIWGPKSGHAGYAERIAAKETAAPRINAVNANWQKDANRYLDDYTSKDGDNDSLINEVTESIERAYSSNNLAENSAAKKEISDAQVQKYVRDLLNQGVAPAKIAQKIEKLAEIELFNHQSATDYLQRNAGLMGLAYLEPNTYMDKSSPTYKHTAGRKTANSFKVVMEKNTSNSCRFATEEEAKAAGQELQSRWMGMPSDWRVEPSTDPVNYRFDQEKYRPVPIDKAPDTIPTGEVESDKTSTVEQCADCGEEGVSTGHMDCQEPGRVSEQEGLEDVHHDGALTDEETDEERAKRLEAQRQKDAPAAARLSEKNRESLRKAGSSNDCMRQHAAFKQQGIQIQARSVKQISACQDCAYFKQSVAGKTCNLYHLPVVANAQELSQIVNHLTPGVPSKQKHAALVQIANGDDKRVQNTRVASQTNIVKTADARVRNQEKRAAYTYHDERESSKKFSSDHIALMHQKGVTLARVAQWAEEKGFPDTDVSFAFRGFVQNLKKNASGKIVLAQDDMAYLNHIGIRNQAFSGAPKCASCPVHFNRETRAYDSDRGAQRVDQKFASRTPDAVRGMQAEVKEVNITAAKVRKLHQAGHSVQKIYNGVASKIGSLQAKKIIAGFIAEFKKTPGKLAVSAADRSFLEGKLGFKPEQIRMLNPNRRPVTQVVANVPDDVNVLSYPGMGKQAGEKKHVDGHSILAEYDLAGAHEMDDIDVSSPQRDEVETNSSFRVELD